MLHRVDVTQISRSSVSTLLSFSLFSFFLLSFRFFTYTSAHSLLVRKAKSTKTNFDLISYVYTFEVRREIEARPNRRIAIELSFDFCHTFDYRSILYFITRTLRYIVSSRYAFSFAEPRSNETKDHAYPGS